MGEGVHLLVGVLLFWRGAVVAGKGLPCLGLTASICLQCTGWVWDAAWPEVGQCGQSAGRHHISHINALMLSFVTSFATISVGAGCWPPVRVLVAAPLPLQQAGAAPAARPTGAARPTASLWGVLAAPTPGTMMAMMTPGLLATGRLLGACLCVLAANQHSCIIITNTHKPLLPFTSHCFDIHKPLQPFTNSRDTANACAAGPCPAAARAARRRCSTRPARTSCGSCLRACAPTGEWLPSPVFHTGEMVPGGC